MTDVGLGQLVTTTGRARSKKLKDAIKDKQPVLKAMDDNGGVKRVDGGRTVVDEAMSAQNATVSWVGESGTVSLADAKVMDAAEFNWAYMLGSVSWTLAERYKNSGGSDTQFIDVVASKFTVLETSMMNLMHEGVMSSGTGTSGLQLDGIPALVSTTPTTATVGGIDRSSSNAAWFRNSKFDTANDWSEGAATAGNIKRILDKGLNATTRNSKIQVDLGLIGTTWFEYLTQAIQAIQIISNETGTGAAGFDNIKYRGVPMYLSGGVSYSGLSQQTATRAYLLNVKDGGVNLVYHQKAEFAMLEPVQSADQAAISRLMFTMATMRIGALAKLNWVAFD